MITIADLMSNFDENEIAIINKTFEISNPVPFSEVAIDSLFMVKQTKKLNKYFTVPREEGEFPPVYLPIYTPIICLKESDNQAVEKMTDYPVSSFLVDSVSEYVYPCRLKETDLSRRMKKLQEKWDLEESEEY